MSIYSGFATRLQEEAYDDCVDSVLYILQKRIIKFYQGEHADEDKFLSMLLKINNQMKSMEAHKYLEPKSSQAFGELIEVLKKKQMNEASQYGNRISEVGSIPTAEFEGMQQRGVKIKRVEPKERESKDREHQATENSMQIKEFASRPDTTNNKIRKRSTFNHGQHYHLSHAQSSHEKSEIRFKPSHNVKHNQYTSHNLPKASTQIRSKSRSQVRSYRQSEYHQTQDITQTFQNAESEQPATKSGAEMRDLIKGYINKTKKVYNKGYARRKQEIDSIFHDANLGKERV